MADAEAPASPAAPPREGTLRQTVRIFPSVVKREITKKSGTTPFLIWVSFLLSFTLARIWVLTFKSVGGAAGKGDVVFSIGRNIIIGGYHVHHIAVGVLLLAIAGWAALHWRGRQIARISAIMYGIGLGFIVDELGFIIGNIQPYRDDVEVFYLAVGIGALLMSAVYFPTFWRSVREDIRGVGAMIASLPSLQEPRRKVTRKQIDRELAAVLGPPAREEEPPHVDPAEVGAPAPTGAAGAEAPTVAHASAPGAEAHHEGHVHEVREPLDKQALFARLLGRIVDVMILIIFAGLLLGLAKLVLSLTTVFIGLSVAAMMQPILVGILTLLIGVELFRAMVEYVRSSRIMLPFLVDAGILLGLRELANELYRRAPDPVLVAVIGGTLVALGGLRVFLVKTMLPAPTAPGAPPEPER